jgi:hypothetical protein
MAHIEGTVPSRAARSRMNDLMMRGRKVMTMTPPWGRKNVPEFIY